MPVNTQAIGKTYEPTLYAAGREKIKEYARAVGETNPVHLDEQAARAAGYADVVAPPMFTVVYSSPVGGPADLRPRDRNQLRDDGARRPGVRVGPAGGGRRRDHDHGERQGHLRARRSRLLRVRVGLHQPARRAGVPWNMDPDSSRSVSEMADLAPGTADSRGEGHPRQVRHGALRGRLGRFQSDPYRRGVRTCRRPARADPARAVDDGPGGTRPDRGCRRSRASEAPLGPVPWHGRARAGGCGQRNGARGKAMVAW